MGIVTAASGASLWRGYEYYKAKKVKSFKKLSDDEYEGLVSGSLKEPYIVKINVARVRQSRCNCPHADGTRIICKHMVALFFTIFPTEADKYIKEVEQYEREEEKRWEEYCKSVEKYVKSLSKEELRQQLINYIIAEEENRRYW
ncbi:MAG: SWIM zinc finger family protein [Clostridia bacterium]|nr:SWIM zinc finger family protein [Clostridia bacterium]